MENPIVVALGISIAGMTLLFLALVLFYGLLSLMTSVLRDRAPDNASPVEDRVTEGGDRGALVQAALIGVALARAQAEQEFSSLGAAAAGEAYAQQHVSPWWALHHLRRMTPGPNPRRVR